MNINKNNYEASFLDYHEGNLSPQQVADLFLFLSQHPELKKELEDFEHIALEEIPSPPFKNKNSLKKNITPDNREEYFIRAIEGTLDPTELMLLNKFLTAYPYFLIEFNLFKKTKLAADPTVVFENKNTLKKATSENDDQLIAAIEGLLTQEEQLLLHKQLAVNAEMQRSFAVYQQTKSVADNTILFKNKQTLKRKERKVIPLFYYAAMAASIALLIGMVSLFKPNNTPNEPGFAEKNVTPVLEQQKSIERTPILTEQKKSGSSFHNKVTLKNHTAVVKKSLKEKNSIDKNALGVTPTTDAKPDEPETSLMDPTVAAINSNTEKQQLLNTIDSSTHQNKHGASDIAKLEKKSEATTAPSFLSLRDLFVAKLKGKLMAKNALEAENKNNTSKKISGWDIAGIFAKGLSNLTGKKVEIKPRFNEQGDVTAYAFSAGKIEFSRVK